MHKIFIQGVPRSGTTILMDTFRYCNGNFVIFNEKSIYAPLFCDSFIYKLPHLCLNTSTIIEMYPKAEIIFLLRDVRDGYASYKKYLNTFKTNPLPEGVNYIEHWKKFTKEIKKYRNKAHFIKFEDFILSPNHQIKLLFNNLKLEFTKELDSFLLNHISDKSINNHYPHTASTLSNLNKIGKWKDELTDYEKEKFLCVTKELEEFGYEI